jgi:CSLREA domain-containing protein
VKISKLFLAVALGLGLTLALVWALDGDLTAVYAANIVVQTTNDGVADDGKCTLREAIMAANSNQRVDTCAAGGADDYIHLKSATYALTAIGTGEEGGRTGDLDIVDRLTIEGTGPGSTIIDASGIISDRVFDVRTGGTTVVISGVTIINGSIAGYGGGIYAESSDLVLINVEVISNTSTGIGSDLRGGGVYVESGSVRLEDTRVISNSADYGGGLYVRDGSVTLSGGEISTNTATNGGGVYVFADGAVFTQTGTAQIAHNTANNGGGMLVSVGRAALDGGEVYDNRAANNGGGVYIGSGSVALSGSNIISNAAGMNGGGVYVSSDGLFAQSGGHVTENRATNNGWGGGVYIKLGRATLSGGQITHNAVTYGGGGVMAYNAGAVFTQTGGLIAYNRANVGAGVGVQLGRATLGGGQVYSNAANYYGGGMYVDEGSATLSGGQVVSNSAVERGGGVYVGEGNVTLSGGEVVSNSADYGGGVYVYDYAGVLTQTGGLIAYNRAGSGGGAGIYRGRMALNGGQVFYNTAGSDGGAFYLENVDAVLTAINATIGHNEAGGSGGGIWVEDGTITITHATVVSNTAATGGEGIHRASGIVALENTIVAHNGTANCAGALTSNGHNLDSGTSCGLGAAGDLANANPLLGPLSEESGAWVYPLLEGSPARDGGACVGGITTDQRGAARPQGDACDIGAYEAWIALTGVSIDGPAEGVIGASYVLTATTYPLTATVPITYTWTPAPDAGQGSDVAIYHWTTGGAKAVTVTAENAGGSALATHAIDIDSQIYLPLVVRNYP